MHEPLKFKYQIISSSLAKQYSLPLKAVDRVCSIRCLSTIQTMITNQHQIHIDIRHQLRPKAAASVSPHSIQIFLTDGSLFSTSLFDPAAVVKTEECLCHTTPTVMLVVNLLNPQQRFSNTRCSNRLRIFNIGGWGPPFEAVGTIVHATLSLHSSYRKGSHRGAFLLKIQ